MTTTLMIHHFLSLVSFSTVDLFLVDVHVRAVV